MEVCILSPAFTIITWRQVSVIVGCGKQSISITTHLPLSISPIRENAVDSASRPRADGRTRANGHVASKGDTAYAVVRPVAPSTKVKLGFKLDHVLI